MKGLRAFEMFVVALVLGVVICFCIQLSLIKDTSVGEVFRGYLPSSAIVQSEGYVARLSTFLNSLMIIASIRRAESWVLLSCLTASI
jgi:Mn2+/Fe2+ NRAMP family transporter